MEHQRGRARSEAARVAILHATARLFADRGYEQLTMEGIAHEAGVGKQTIYRWWASKGALVADCLLEGLLLPEGVAPDDTGDIRADLATWLHKIFVLLENKGGPALMRSLIAAGAESDDVGGRLGDTFGTSSFLVERFESAVAAGQVPPDAPLQQMGEALLGAVIFRTLTRAPSDADVAARLVDVALGPRVAPDGIRHHGLSE
jgi:AcrR family transcriptional regulator